MNGSLPRMIDASPALQGAEINGVCNLPNLGFSSTFWYIMCDIMVPPGAALPLYPGAPYGHIEGISPGVPSSTKACNPCSLHSLQGT